LNFSFGHQNHAFTDQPTHEKKRSSNPGHKRDADADGKKRKKNLRNRSVVVFIGPFCSPAPTIHLKKKEEGKGGKKRRSPMWVFPFCGSSRRV